MSSMNPSLQAHLDERLAHHGLERVAAAIRPLAREAIHLTTAGPDDYSQLGNTRLGGLPDLPVGLTWPTVTGEDGRAHLGFLAQVNLSQLPRTADELLPQEGMLYFFSEEVGGHDFVRAIYHPGGGRLKRAKARARLCPFFDEGDSNLRPHQATVRLVVSTPNYASWDPEAKEMWQALQELDLTDAYFDLQKSLIGPKHGRPGQGHQLLGYPTGVRLTGKPSDDRVLLFEMDSDKAIGTCWSDSGLLHVLIHQNDLTARRFDRVSSGLFSG
jgi:uncharacterized protein YwqG